jgi:hypothetical protein
MNFEYEITVDEYVSSQILCHKLSGGRKRTRSAAVGWILGGVCLILVAWNQGVLNWPTVLLAAVGAWLIYAGVASFFPTCYFRRGYHKTELAGQMFKADVNENGFEVTGDLRRWYVQWPAVRLKGENARVFIFYTPSTIFMFGKKYLSDEQQKELRKLCGLEAPKA